MRRSMQWFRELAATLFARPDEIMLEIGAGGELLVARLRALLSALILLLPLANAAAGAKVSETLIGLAAAVFVNVMAQLWLALARGGKRRGWLPYATGTYDITTTTGVLLLLALGDRVAAVNSMVVWCFYLIGIAMTALRNDGRLTLYVGSLAIVQYALLVWAVLASAGSPDQLVSVDYGTASVASQVERLILLLMMSLLTVTIVYRMQRLVELSGRDGLTGLPNRMWLLQRMPRIFEQVRSESGSLTLALLDIDRFKRVNDEIGHHDGDRAIRQIAAALDASLGERDRLIRLGGEEFVLLLHCPIGSAWERIDRVRRAIAESPFLPGRGADPQRITISAGLAAWPQDGADLSALLGSADRRLRQAKRDGCNRVIAREV
ncbi:MAG TPA: GGDEF domain-containing protein [Luteimonas sp.]|nr:GGDEF domain-containing protein [Luteimonas sp.]